MNLLKMGLAVVLCMGFCVWDNLALGDDKASGQTFQDVLNQRNADAAPHEPAVEKTEKPKKHAKKRRSTASITTEAPAPSGKSGEAELFLKTDAGCFVVNFPSLPGEIVSCSEMLPIKYSKRNCENRKLIEQGEVEGAQCLVVIKNDCP